VIAVALLSGTAALGGALLASPLRADQAMAMSAAAGIATFGAGVFLRRRLGGLGGDAFGAIIELAEAAALAAYVMTAR
jgi:cobalamin synthase